MGLGGWERDKPWTRVKETLHKEMKISKLQWTEDPPQRISLACQGRQATLRPPPTYTQPYPSLCNVASTLKLIIIYSCGPTPKSDPILFQTNIHPHTIGYVGDAKNPINPSLQDSWNPHSFTRSFDRQEKGKYQQAHTERKREKRKSKRALILKKQIEGHPI